MKKHVWILNHYAGGMFFDQGGRHYNFAKYLKRSGYEPVVFCANSKHGEPERFFDMPGLWDMRTAEEIGVPWIFVKARTYVGNGKQRILNMVDFYRNVKKAAREYAAQHGKPDVIYASSVHPLTLVAGIQLAKRFGVKCVCEVRDLWPERLVAYGIVGPHHPAVVSLRWLEKWIYENADAMVFTMEGIYDYIKEQGWEKDVPRSKVHYINNGVDLESFQYNREYYQTEDADLDDPDICKVVYTGSIRKANNLNALIDIAKQVTDPRIKFLLWGAGDEVPALQRRITDGQIKNVVYKGRVEKKYIPSIISRANYNYVDTYDNEIGRFGNSQNKLFEYFAAGRPVLMYQQKYNPADIFSCGLFYHSEEELLETMGTLNSLPKEKYERLCQNAKAAAKEYDFENLTKKLIDVMEG